MTDKIDKPQTLKDAITNLSDAVERTVKYFRELDAADVPRLLEAYRLIHENAEHLDTLNSIVADIKKKISYETIPKVFESMGIDSIKSKGRNYIVGVRFNASIPIDKRDKGYDWLRANKLDTLIQPIVNPKSLSSAIQKFIEENAIEPPDDCMTLHKQTYTSIRKT